MMDILRFDEAKLIAALGQLSARRRSLFAALVATRLSGAFEIYARDAGAPLDGIRAASDHLWRQVESELSSNAVETEGQIEAVLALISDEDSSAAYGAQAEDAAAALAYALRSVMDPNPQEAAWTARRAYECVDNLVISRESVEIGGPAEERIVQDPLIQSELARQREDLETATLSALDPAILVRHREDCTRWGMNFFGEVMRNDL